MCFSAPVSFIASGALTVLGGATFAVAQKKDKILVAIPLMFGIQQAFEGVQWLYLNSGSTSLLAGYGFLFFALIVWPIYVPLFVYVLDKERKKPLRWLILMGLAVALYFVALLERHALHIHERYACVSYTFDFNTEWLVVPLYLLTVFGSLFISSRAIFRWFGLAISLLALVSWKFYTMNFISVWCFFAAVVSSMFFVYVRYRRSARLEQFASWFHRDASKFDFDT